MKQYELANGVRLVVKQRSSVPLVSMAIGVAGGSGLESKQHAGYTALMARSSIKGTASRTAAQLAEQAERMGGSISPSAGSDLLDWEMSVPSRHFTDAFELLADVAFNASIPEAELEVERKLTLADLQHARDDMYRYPLRLCMQAAFADHAYGFSLQDVEQGIAAATAQQLRAWRSERLRSEPWAIVVGDVDPDRVARVVEQNIATVPVIAAAQTPAVAWPAQPAHNMETRDKAQTAIALGFPGPQRNHEDVYALQVLANAVGGLGGRFFEELRSKRSLAYTVALLPVFRSAGGAFMAYLATTPEREDEARAALLAEFERLCAEPLPAVDVARSQRYTIGTWQIRSQTNSAQLSDLLHALLIGEGLEELEQFEERIRAVDAERVQAVAQRYFKPEVAVAGIVRGTGKSR